MRLTSTDELTSRLRAFRSRYGVPAVGAAILTPDDQSLVAVTGVRVRGGGEPVTQADRWHIGSCCKSITAAHVARLVQRGDIRWDASLYELFDDLGPERHPGWRRVTISDVLTHHSGLAANPTAAELRAAQNDPAPPPAQRTALVGRALAAPPNRYGTFRYSNLGSTVAGAAIERITGEPFESALRNEILEPLGMSSAGFGAPTGQQPWGHRPRLLFVGRGPAIAPAHTVGRQPADNPPVLTPAGRLHVTLDDWARFIRLFLEPSGNFLDPSSIATITTPAPGSRQGMGWAVVTGRAARYGITLGQQGSNLRWMATAAVTADRRRAALVVCNDGRPRLTSLTWTFASSLLQSPQT